MRVHLRKQIKRADVPLEFLAFSSGYFASAEQLARALAGPRFKSNYFKGQAAKFLAFHAVELFFKACVLQHSPSHRVNGHSLMELHMQFKQYYPTVQFDPLFQTAPLVPYPGLVELERRKQATFQEVLKYPVDKHGNPWPGTRGFAPRQFAKSLKRLGAELDRVTSIIFPGV